MEVNGEDISDNKINKLNDLELFMAQLVENLSGFLINSKIIEIYFLFTLGRKCIDPVLLACGGG